MKKRLILDESLCHELKEAMDSVEAIHQEDLGWKGISNGKLLTAAEEAHFDFIVTADKNMPYQQNIAKRRLSLIVLDIHPGSRDNQLSCSKKIERIALEEAVGKVFVVDGPNQARR